MIDTQDYSTFLIDAQWCAYDRHLVGQVSTAKGAGALRRPRTLISIIHDKCGSMGDPRSQAIAAAIDP